MTEGLPGGTTGGRILCIGEAMAELAPVEGGLYRMGFAGDTLNTAWYLRALLGPEWRVGFVSAIGDDPVSGELVAFVAGAGIETEALMIRPGMACGLYLIRLVDGDREFAYWRGQSAARTLARDAGELGSALAGADWLHLSGITLAILPPEARERLLHEVARRRGAGVRVSFDPNYRPRLWEGVEAARDWTGKAASMADMVFPSFSDEAVLWGDAEPDATVARYRAGGAGEIVVKDGAGPVTLWAGVRRVQVPAASVTPRDPTGAGDAFDAAYLAARIGGLPPEAAARRACDLGARVTKWSGALMPREKIL